MTLVKKARREPIPAKQKKAWSDDPEWENKARQATKNYSLSKGVKNFVANNM